MLESLVWIAAERPKWIRPLEQWKPRTRNAKRQFRSLLRHLFDQHNEVPGFMDQAWSTRIGDGEGAIHREWYLHLGAGRSPRAIEFPIQLTKPMLRQFFRAGDELSIVEAVRWAQVMGMNGSPPLASAILGTRLGGSFRDEEFWVTVIRWFIDQPMLDTVHVAPIVDYLHNQRFVPEHRFGAGEESPPEPNLTMRGRSAQSLLRQVECWHRRLSGSNRIQVHNWKSSGLAGFEFAEGKETAENFRIWTIRELLGTAALVTEGRKLKHCVASYAYNCARGSTSIWTLEVESFAGVEKRITIEVNPATKTIVQARGKANRTMREQERGIVRRWCAVAGVKMSSYV